jgi:hypothetical protein
MKNSRESCEGSWWSPPPPSASAASFSLVVSLMSVAAARHQVFWEY